MDSVDMLRQYIENSDNIVFFGGAGVSTESGIPDFRSVDGVLYDAGMKTLICYPGARADQTLSIPSSVTVIAPYAFSDCTTLKTVEFAGSSSEWKGVNVGDDNAVLANAKVSYAKEDGK